MALVDKTNAVTAAESMALEQQHFAFSQEREARGEAAEQLSSSSNWNAPNRALHGNRVARALHKLELFDAGRADQLLLDCDVRQREWEWHAFADSPSDCGCGSRNMSMRSTRANSRRWPTTLAAFFATRCSASTIGKRRSGCGMPRPATRRWSSRETSEAIRPTANWSQFWPGRTPRSVRGSDP